MPTKPEATFANELWERLPERVIQEYAPLRQTLHEGSDEELHQWLNQLLWLVPLAETLKTRAELHGTYPELSGATIKRNRYLPSVSRMQRFTFFAEAEGLFRLSLDELRSDSESCWDRELGKGIAEQVVELLVSLIQDEMNETSF